MARKKKIEESENSYTHIDPNFEDVQLELEPEDKQISYKQNKKRPKTAKVAERGTFAPFALTLGLMMIGALVFSIFYRPVSSSLIAPKTNESLRIFLSITTSEFATEGSASGSLEICRGTKEFPGIDKATEAASKNMSTCLYELILEPVPDFPGTKLNVFVRFPFGDSNTFLVDVGSEAPYKKINIRLTLG